MYENINASLDLKPLFMGAQQNREVVYIFHSKLFNGEFAGLA